jgi:hypothetical protein
VELAGCADTDFAVVDDSVDIGTKPNPATSVCDIDTVVGPGIGTSDSGLMDDLTREEGISLQYFPNPRQEGDRTGSWSWYPLTHLEGGIEDGALHMTGGAATQSDWAWMGVTLAFLGGNGAGACYDVSAYTGIQFDVKGTITAVDDPSTNWIGPDANEATFFSNKLIISLVTAETQTQKFGGDLDGTGGHFNYFMDTTMNASSYTTVKIPFSDFNTPTWGDTLSLSSLAKGKMQAIDFGIVNTASDVDIYLDNIKLY